jgi:hypothetical protein
MEGPLEHLDFLVDSSTIFFCSNTSAGHWICLTSQKGDDSAGPGVLTMGNPSVMHHFDELPWGRYGSFWRSGCDTSASFLGAQYGFVFSDILGMDVVGVLSTAEQWPC